MAICSDTELTRSKLKPTKDGGNIAPSRYITDSIMKKQNSKEKKPNKKKKDHSNGFGSLDQALDTIGRWTKR